MNEEGANSTLVAAGSGSDATLDAISEILKSRNFRKHGIRTVSKIYKKVFVSDLKYSLIVSTVLSLVFLLLVYVGIVDRPQFILAIISCIIAVFIYPSFTLPWVAIFRNRLWYREAMGVRLDGSKKLLELAAYVQRSRSVDILNVVNLSGDKSNNGRADDGSVAPALRAAAAELVDLRNDIEKLDHSIEMYEQYPVEHRIYSRGGKVQLTENSRKKRQPYIKRPKSFVTAYSIGIGLIVLGAFGVIALAASYVEQSRVSAPLNETRATIYAFVIMAALVCIGTFSTVANLWEQVAWKKFATSKEHHGLYFDATKELRDYTVTICYGSLVVAFICVVMLLAQVFASEQNQNDLNFPELGNFVLTLFVLLTLNSAGKLLGSGRSSLDKALLSGSKISASPCHCLSYSVRACKRQ